MITLTATITLADGTEMPITKRNMLTIDQNIVDRSNISAPSFGIISNGGSIELIDYDYTIKKLSQSNQLNDKAIITIFLSNTLIKNCVSQIGCFYTSQWSYDDSGLTARATLTDDLTEWQDIQTQGFNLKRYEMTGKDIYDYLVEITPSKWSFQELDSKTLKVLQEYKVDKPYLKKGNLWSQWNKLCVACGIYIFKNHRNKVVVSYDFRS